MSERKIKILFINFQSGMNMSKGYMQYFTNGWKYIFPHNSEALSDVIEFINKENPDVVLFAEIDGSSWRSKKVNQIKIISEKTNLKYKHFFPTRVVGKWINQGNAIISKQKQFNSKQIELPGYGEKRYLCSSEIKINEQKIKYYTTHLSTNKHVNMAQRCFIAEKIKEDNDKIILTGDFNITKKYLGLIKKQTQLKDLDFDKTFPSWKPTSVLDHIFVNESLRVNDFFTYNDVKFSDHIPIGVEIDM